ncbi:MAG: hypothetical protein KIS94_05085 [Chitinophagales bacterium]|nr:hypothetical protein [Chitinophagales bacterium]
MEKYIRGIFTAHIFSDEKTPLQEGVHKKDLYRINFTQCVSKDTEYIDKYNIHELTSNSSHEPDFLHNVIVFFKAGNPNEVSAFSADLDNVIITDVRITDVEEKGGVKYATMRGIVYGTIKTIKPYRKNEKVIEDAPVDKGDGWLKGLGNNADGCLSGCLAWLFKLLQLLLLLLLLAFLWNLIGRGGCKGCNSGGSGAQKCDTTYLYRIDTVYLPDGDTSVRYRDTVYLPLLSDSLQNQGKIKVYNDEVEIVVGDFMDNDNDIVNLYLNDVLIDKNVVLSSLDIKVYKLLLDEGINEIKIETVSAGLDGKIATPDILIFDGDRKISLRPKSKVGIPGIFHLDL